MVNFATLTAKLNLNIQNFSAQLATASAQASKFSAELSGKINEGYVAPAKKAGVEFKDVARIVQGILVSKVFYSGLNAIRQASSAVWQFTKDLEFAKMAYSNLFGDVALAEEFINVLKDFAARTPFTFKESEAAAKRLLAYGVQYKNVMYMMNGVLAAASVQGNPQVIESISRALGQIYTKGRLMNEEMRQLAEAGIPAYEILRQKLGLTQKQLQNLGREAIPASTAINALIDGMNERYSGVLDLSAQTLTGILSNIRDNATMLAAGMTEPLNARFKAFFAEIGKGLFVLRELQETKGIGAVFEHIIPKDMQGPMRMFFANIGAILHLIAVNAGNVKMLAGYIGSGLVTAFNMVAPPIITVLEIVSYLQRALLENKVAMKILTGALIGAATAFVLFRIQATAAMAVKGLITVINGISKALLFMSAAFAKSPMLTIMFLVAGALVGVAVASDKANGAISKFFKSISGFNGMDPDKILLPSQKDRAADLEKFNNKLDGTKDSMDELSKKTSKASKSLLSFDEAYKLTKPGAGDGIDPGNIDIPIPNLGAIGDMLTPDIPDFGEFASSYVKGLVDSLKTRLLGAGIGAIIGGALGAAIAGPAGAKLGAVAGALIGGFWTDIMKALGIAPVQQISIGFGAAIGAAIGGMLGGPAGAAIGAIIGAVAGTLSQWLFGKIAEQFGLGAADLANSGIGTQIGAGIGLIIGGIFGGPAGAAIGVAIGYLVGGIVGLFWNKIVEGFSTDTGHGVLIGGGIGAILGGIFFGPPGAAIGGALGATIGGIVGYFWDNLIAAFSTDGGQGALIGTIIGALLGGPVGAIVGGVLGNIIGENKIAIYNWATETAASVSTWATETSLKLTTWWGDTKLGFNTWFTDTKTGLATWWSESVLGFTTWTTDTTTGLTTWWTNTKLGFNTWFTDTKTSLGTWWTDTKNTFTLWSQGNTTVLSTWWSNTKTGFNTWKSDTATKVSEWSSDTKTRFATWTSETRTQFSTWSSNIGTSINTWSSNTKNAFNNWRSETSAAFSGWWSSTKSGFSSWASGVYDSVVGTFNRIVSSVRDAWNSITSWFNDAQSKANSMPTPSYNGGGAGSANTPSKPKWGHAKGGIFNREHVANFAEGNKAEAIIPLEDYSAMQPFVDAVSSGISASLGPILASVKGSDNSSLPPLYVGTLVADERGLKELNRKMQVIQLQESSRRGE